MSLFSRTLTPFVYSILLNSIQFRIYSILSANGNAHPKTGNTKKKKKRSKNRLQRNKHCCVKKTRLKSFRPLFISLLPLQSRTFAHSPPVSQECTSPLSVADSGASPFYAPASDNNLKTSRYANALNWTVTSSQSSSTFRKMTEARGADWISPGQSRTKFFQ